MDVIVDDALAAQRNRAEPVGMILTATVRERVAEAADWVHAYGSVVEADGAESPLVGGGEPVSAADHRTPVAVDGLQIQLS
jgi:hypothetical protein